MIDASSDPRRSHLFHAEPKGFAIEVFDKADIGSASTHLAHIDSGSWLAFRLEGAASSRQVLQARAEAVVGDLTAIWTNYADRLKEDLLLRTRPAGDQIVFHVSQNGLTFVPDHAGGYLAQDWRAITRFHVLAPTVHDALGRPGTVTLGLTETRAVLNLESTFAASATYPITIDPTVTYSGADIQSGTPATTTYGSSVTLAWDGISSATPADWIGLYVVGAPIEPRGTWNYVNCTRTPTSAVPTGSCTFTMPSSDGNYEFRLFSNDTDSLLAISNTIAVSAAASTWTALYGPLNFTMQSGSCCPNQTVPIPAGASEWRLTITQTYGNGNTMNFTLGCGSPETNLATVQSGAWNQQQDLSGLVPPACQGQSLHLVGWCPFGYWGGTFTLYTRSGPPRPPVPSTGYGAAVWGDGPAAYWRLNESGGFHARDMTPSQNDAQALSGATMGAPGVLPADTAERGASFDGNWGEIKAWNSSSLQNLSALTVEVWMSVKGVPGNGFSTLVAKHSSADRGPYGFVFSAPGGQGGYALGFQDSAVNGSGVLRWNVNGTDLDALPNFQLNTPYHIVATADASGMRLYVNGGLVATGGGATLSFADQPLYFGLDVGQAYTPWSPFRGSLGEVAIYGKVLGLDQVRTHYQIGSGCVSVPNASAYSAAILGDSPAAYWQLGDQCGYGIADSSPSHNHGGRTGFVTTVSPGLLSGDSDGARSFAGNTSSNGLVAPSSSLAPTAGLSLETWMPISGVPGNGWSTLIAKHSTADRGPYGFTFTTPGGQGGYALGFQDTAVNGSGVLRWNVNGTDLDAAPNFQLNTPYHIVATADASGMRLYLNGELVASGAPASLSFTTDQPLYLGLDGGQLYTSWSPFQGILDEAAVYAVALDPNRIAAHYWIAKGDPPPLVHMTAPAAATSVTSPVTVSWAPLQGVDPAEIKTYTVSYAIDETTPAILTRLTRDPGGNLPTNFAVYVGDNTQYRFNVEATSYTGKVSGLVGQSGWATTHTSLPPVTSDGPDDDKGLFDPTAELPCFPPTNPDPLNLATELLLMGQFCSPTVEADWGPNPQVDRSVCPGSVPLPGPLSGTSALLGVTDYLCVELGQSGVVLAGGKGLGVRQQADVARLRVLARAAGLSGSAAAAVANGVDKIMEKVDQHLAAGQPWAAWGYVRQLQRLDVYLAYLKVLNPAGVVNEIESVEVPLATNGRIPDLIVRFVSNPTQRVILDNKLWSQPYLDKVLSTTSKFNLLTDQLRGYLDQTALEDRVIIEFVKTQRNGIVNLDTLKTRLGQILTDAQMARLELRQVDTLLEQSRAFGG